MIFDSYATTFYEVQVVAFSKVFWISDDMEYFDLRYNYNYWVLQEYTWENNWINGFETKLGENEGRLRFVSFKF